MVVELATDSDVFESEDEVDDESDLSSSEWISGLLGSVDLSFTEVVGSSGGGGVLWGSQVD